MRRRRRASHRRRRPLAVSRRPSSGRRSSHRRRRPLTRSPPSPSPLPAAAADALDPAAELFPTSSSRRSRRALPRSSLHPAMADRAAAALDRVAAATDLGTGLGGGGDGPARPRRAVVPMSTARHGRRLNVPCPGRELGTTALAGTARVARRPDEARHGRAVPCRARAARLENYNCTPVHTPCSYRLQQSMELRSAAPVPGTSSSTVVARRRKMLRLLAVAAVATALSSQLVAFLAGGSSDLPLPAPGGASRWWWPSFSVPQTARQPAAGKGTAACVMFNFGDSNSDTGNLVAGAGFRLHRPVGRRFFGKPSGRFSDGRLYIDFICERLGLDHLSPYLESSGVSFRHVANFAAAGATTGGGECRSSQFNFNLGTQVRQFRHFKSRTADLLRRGLGGPGITVEEFQNAVYTFDIGQNDVQAALLSDDELSPERILETVVPGIVTRIRNAVTMVHEAGGRKFVVYNTGPLGCLPSTLARRRAGAGELVDGAGCLAGHNRVAMAFNARLGRLCRDLRAELANSTVVCVDMYAVKYGLFANHTAHGFSEPFTACCGSGGAPYNYEAGKACGSPKVKACAASDRRITWDGVHYTEAANRIVADKVLSAEYSDPPLQLQTLCGEHKTQTM